MLKNPNTSHLQSKRKKKGVVLFTKKNKANSVSKIERLQWKLTKFSFHETEHNVIWVKTATQINDALEATVDFCR